LAWHKWVYSTPLQYNISILVSSYSTNGGYSFLAQDSVMPLGEDKSFIWNENTHEYWGYVRPRSITPDCYYYNGIYTTNGKRKIALMKNNGFFPSASAWSARDTIVEIQDSEFNDSSSPDYRTQTYYMQVFRSGTDWWGLVGMYRLGNNGAEHNVVPHTYPEFTSDVELMWSDDGEDWYRTNNRQPILPLHDSIRTIYAVGTLVEDSVYMYSAESTILHSYYFLSSPCTGTRDVASYAGREYSIYLYKISVSKLNEWRPPSVVNITSGIEGFMNGGTGKHVLRDTLTAELRSSTTPYGVESIVKAVVDSSTLSGTYNFPHVTPGLYYLTLEGRNSLETWSASGISISNSSSASYDFTSGSIKAYGGNLISVGGKYCIYSGDVDNDNIIDVTDEIAVYNDASNTVSGYVDTDLNGDYFVDSSDILLVFNNSYLGIMTISP
jgi:hypothetical protein